MRADPLPTVVVASSLLASALTLSSPVSAVAVSGVAAQEASEVSREARDPVADEHLATIGRFCLRCHSDASRRGGLTLEAFDPGTAEHQASVAEKMIRKLSAGMMPPPSARRRPDEQTVAALVAYLKTRVDNAAAVAPDPGRRTFQRLNRAEYSRSVRELLGLEVDVAAFLPPDTISHGFDNIADVQTLSATLMDGYLRAADRIARLAVGDPEAVPAEATYKVPRTASQLDRAEGAPYGSRGGLAVTHNFPADGEYVFKLMLHSAPTGPLFGMNADGERLEVAVDGRRVALLDIDPLMSESDPNGMTIETGPIQVTAGPHTVAAVFVPRFDGPVDDIVQPIEHTLADTQIGTSWGITTLPHLRDLTVSGPYNVTGVSATPSRERIFTCRPLGADDEEPCAGRILDRLASRAYRRPLEAADLEGLLGFYRQGAREGGFEAGVRMALQAVLASPHFVFRLERAPDEVRAGGRYRIADLELASRLAFFLWGTVPDETLLEVARSGELGRTETLRAQVGRMLEDPRAEALATRFAAQWLRLQDLDKIHPDALEYPHFDQTLAAAMRRETELLFDAVVREDRSVLELLTADFTFVNERLARHYGVPNVVGPHFRRVPVADAHRRGLLGQGSILTLTSHANRTSPVLRGKWVMEVLMGTPPPPPPPDVPDLEETDAVEGARVLSVRERLEEHRANPACSSCHDFIDPIGLALENYDVTGAWRIKDAGVDVDPTGELYDGTPLQGPEDLRRALLARPEVLVTAFTENLLAYALGRRIEHTDMPAIRAIVVEAARNDYRISSFLYGVVESPAFRMARADGGAVADDDYDD